MDAVQGDTYLFVDGRNLRTYFDEITRKWFGQQVEFDFNKIKHFFSAEKAFYYDCIDDVKSDSETQDAVDARVKLQQEQLNKIREINGCHVFLGSLSGKGKKKRQKEVDVLLTVQMMEHAVRKNMRKAVLLSGDKDFRPLVESLVRLGLFVEVAGDKNHISQDLIHSADSHKKLNFEHYWAWTSDEYQILNRIDFETYSLTSEGLSNYDKRQDIFTLEKKGKIGEDDIYIYLVRGRGIYHLVSPTLLGDIIRTHANLQKMELYIELRFGEVIWE